MDGAKEYDAVFSIPSIAEGAGGGGPVPPIPEPVHRSAILRRFCFS